MDEKQFPINFTVKNMDYVENENTENSTHIGVTPTNKIETKTLTTHTYQQQQQQHDPKKMQVKYEDFLKKHSIKKEDKEKIQSTNTRIGDGNKIYGGSYHIPTEEYNTFLELYFNEVFLKKKEEYLTEKQSDKSGPILVDIDLRFSFDTTQRYYTNEHLDDLVDAYLEILKKAYQFDDETDFQIYLFEKPKINNDSVKKVTKDGVHMIIAIDCEHTSQQLIRLEMVKKLEEIWGGDEFPITNTWEEVLDRGISVGTTNWQLYGSKKPNYDVYKLTKIYDIGFNGENDEFIRPPAKNPPAPNTDEMKKLFFKLSARYENHMQYLYKSAFLKERDAKISSGDIVITGEGRVGTGNRPPVSVDGNTTLSGIGLGGGRGGGTSFAEDPLKYIQFFQKLMCVKTHEELMGMMDEFLDGLQSTETDLEEAYLYAMTLPENYYTDYNRWIRVGWALKHVGDKLFIVWVVFSSQTTDKFKFSDIPTLYSDYWAKFDLTNTTNGLTKRSIMHWSRIDAPEKYEITQKKCIDFYINQTLSTNGGGLNNATSNAEGGRGQYGMSEKGCGEYDLAVVLYQLRKGDFVCASVKNNIWYSYNRNRWEDTDSGTLLRKTISNEMRDLYQVKMREIIAKKSEIDKNGKDNEELHKMLTSRALKIQEIILRLARTNDKKNIMTEAKELFYDPSFIGKLDTNPYLLCFENGVIDFKTNQFRKGYPDDYLSITTGINYVPIDRTIHRPIIDEINDFMRKLFPVEELCVYMWEHLASTLIGTSSNQTFNMYIGMGQNGKSVLVSLMEKVLGGYKGDVPLSLVTDKRTKIGGLAPETVALRGIRYAVMQEPSKGDTINEGVMKQLTSGIDPIQARAPYMPQSITFIPQFKLAVCSNELMTIKSQDHGTWRRIRVVPFLSLFVENPADNDPDPEKRYQYLLDKNIKEKFEKWKEIFASLLVEKVFETGGNVKDCETVLAKSRSYRENEDYIAEYVSDKIVEDPNATLQKAELLSDYKAWYSQTHGGHNVPNPKDIQSYMDRKYGSWKVYRCWRGVRINYDVDINAFVHPLPTAKTGGGGKGHNCDDEDNGYDEQKSNSDDINLEEL